MAFYPDSDWPSAAGTCFLVVYRAHFFALTAKHCVSQKDAGHGGGGEWFIPVWVDENEAITLATCGYHELVRAGDVADDDHLNDIAALEISPTGNEPGTLGKVSFILIDHVPTLNLEGKPLTILGYPFLEQKVTSVDPPQISVQLNDLSAVIERNNSDGTLTARIADNLGNGPLLSSLDGFSGSPVFYLDGNQAILTGLTIRGSQTSAERLTFIPISRQNRSAQCTTSLLNAPLHPARIPV